MTKQNFGLCQVRFRRKIEGAGIEERGGSAARQRQSSEIVAEAKRLYTQLANSLSEYQRDLLSILWFKLTGEQNLRYRRMPAVQIDKLQGLSNEQIIAEIKGWRKKILSENRRGQLLGELLQVVGQYRSSLSPSLVERGKQGDMTQGGGDGQRGDKLELNQEALDSVILKHRRREQLIEGVLKDNPYGFKYTVGYGSDGQITSYEVSKGGKIFGIFEFSTIEREGEDIDIVQCRMWNSSLDTIPKSRQPDCFISKTDKIESFVHACLAGMQALFESWEQANQRFHRLADGAGE